MNLSLRPTRLRLCAALLAVAATGARAAISEGFETGAAGWTSIDVAVTSLQSAAYTSAGTPNPVTHHASGGNPGGYLSAADPSGETFLFDAPPAFLGNLAAYAGGTLSYDVFYTPHYNEWRGDPDVILSNGTTTLFYLGTSNPGIDWTHFSVTLAPGAGWTVGTFGGTAASAADFAAVLSSTTLLRIRAEYLADVAETTGLDNVTLTAVPEPGTWALLAAGLGLVGLSGARRRSR